MALPTELADRYTAQHRDAQSRLLDVLAGRLALELGRLDNLSDEQARLYVARAVPLIVAGQRRAATLAAGYARMLAPRRDDLPLELDVAEVAVTAETAWVASPIIRARTELGRRQDDEPSIAWAAALGIAASKARGYLSGDLAVAERFGLERGALSTGARVRGYRKVLAGGACAWCRSVSDGLYARAGSVPFHERDACSVAPVFDD